MIKIQTRGFGVRQRVLWKQSARWGALVLVLGLAAGCAPHEEAATTGGSGEGVQATPSAMDHTYHGEAVKARARAIRTLEGVEAQRKGLEQEERSFERPAEPTPREAP